MRLVCHHTFCIYPSNWYLCFCRTSLVSAGKCDILTDRDILGGRTPPYLCSRPCLPSFREIVRAVLEKNAEMTNIEGKRQGRSNLGCHQVLHAKSTTSRTGISHGGLHYTMADCIKGSSPPNGDNIGQVRAPSARTWYGKLAIGW